MTNQVDLWRFKLDSPPSNITTCLSKDEVERANRFHFQKHQHRFSVARAAMRTILSKYLNINAKEITFQYKKNGKPFVSTSTSITFNLSHTGDYACLGIGLQSPIGIDIELFSARQYMGIASIVFSKSEQQQLNQIPIQLLPLAFFSLWSQKEAVIKCNGLGIQYPLQQLTLPLFSPPGYQFIDAVDKKNLQVHRFTPYLGTAAALCCQPNITKIRLFDWEI